MPGAIGEADVFEERGGASTSLTGRGTGQEGGQFG
jgi:hypothetical protein